ncbi:MAG: hypothetical protein ACLT1W_12575 [Alistipes onderdonkii]
MPRRPLVHDDRINDRPPAPAVREAMSAAMSPAQIRSVFALRA